MLKVCYSPKYYAVTHTNSMEKLSGIAEVLAQSDYAELVDPDLIDPAILRQVHDPDYVDAFLKGEQPLASFQGFKWTRRLRNAVLAVQAGQLMAAKLAWKEGIAANIAQGFHHAMYEYGGAYCTFNGLALVAQQHPDKKIFVLDCDQHGGNGTAEFTRRLPNLFNFSICGLQFGCASYERSVLRLIDRKEGTFEQYMAAVKEGFQQALDWQADLIIYQAGMDCHQKDRFGSAWLDTDMIYERDQVVFQLARQHQVPLVFVLAGGYQPLSDLIPLHLNTFKAAAGVYGG